MSQRATTIPYSVLQPSMVKYVTANGPDDGGNFGPHTIGPNGPTTTAGVQEAINAAPERGMVIVGAGVQAPATSTINITKNLSLIGLYPGTHNDAFSTPETNAISTGNLSITASAELLNAVYVKGLTCLGLFTIDGNANATNRLVIEDCTFYGGVTHKSNTGINSDSTVYNRCWFMNPAYYGGAIPTTWNGVAYGGAATYLVKSTGSNNVNQTFFNNCSLLGPQGTSGESYIFLIDNANFYPVFTGSQLFQTTTPTHTTVFKMYGTSSPYSYLQALCGPSNYTEFDGSTGQIVEALTSNCTDPQIILDWNCYLYGSVQYNLVNITSTATEYGFIRLRGGIEYGSLPTPGTWVRNNSNQLVVDVDMAYPAMVGWNANANVASLVIPSGTGATHTATNPFTQKIRVFPQSAYSGLHIIDNQNNDKLTSAPSLTPFDLCPLEQCYFTTTVPTSWFIYGLT